MRAGADGERVRQSVKVVTELLAADHLKPAPQPEVAKELRHSTSLARWRSVAAPSASRFRLDVHVAAAARAARRAPGRRSLDASSPVFAVDHSACILCDRCVRACDDVMENHVIGRTGKGLHGGHRVRSERADGGIELRAVRRMHGLVPDERDHVQAGGHGQAASAARAARKSSRPAELLRDPVFAGVPPKFLLWQQGLVVRRQLRAGHSSLPHGRTGQHRLHHQVRQARGRGPRSPACAAPIGRLGGILGLAGRRPSRVQLTPADVIAGEMACLSGSPRAADVTVLQDAEVWEVRRNVLDRLMRLPSRRAAVRGGVP